MVLMVKKNSELRGSRFAGSLKLGWCSVDVNGKMDGLALFGVESIPNSKL